MTGITASTFVQPADFAKELQQYLGDKSGGPVRNVMNLRASHPLVLDRSSQRVNQCFPQEYKFLLILARVQIIQPQQQHIFRNLADVSFPLGSPVARRTGE